MSEYQVSDARDDLPFFVHSELDDYGLDPYEFRIYARLVRRAGNLQGQCTESIPNMASNTGMSERKVRYSLKVLEAAGFIRKVEATGSTNEFKLEPKRHWISKEAFPKIKAEALKTDPDKKPQHKDMTPAPDAAPIDTPTPAPDAALPLHDMQPPPAPDAAKGTPFKVIPDKVIQESTNTQLIKEPTDVPTLALEKEKILSFFGQKMLNDLYLEDPRRQTAWPTMSVIELENFHKKALALQTTEKNWRTLLKGYFDLETNLVKTAEPRNEIYPGGPVHDSRDHAALAKAKREAEVQAEEIYAEVYHIAMYEKGLTDELAHSAGLEARQAFWDSLDKSTYKPFSKILRLEASA